MDKMKSLHTIFGLLWVFMLLVGCDKMNDVQKKFASQEEQVYLGKVDSLKCVPGFGRAKIVWSIGSDPRIERTIVYWNMRKDSLVIPFHRNTPGIQKDSIIVENLPEGTSLYEFRNTNSSGESSLYSSLSVFSWGLNFAESLQGLRLRSKEFDYGRSVLKLIFSDCVEGDNVQYIEIQYSDADGTSHTLRVPRNMNSIELPNFRNGETAKFRTVFFLSDGIDTVYNDYQTVRAPQVIEECGTKLTIGNGLGNRYFEHEGSLCEWNASGDVVFYDPDGNGSFVRSRVISALAPPAYFRDFFFYDDDKYIGITRENKVDMYRLDLSAESPVLAVVKKGFGSSFNMLSFIPARGFFYSLDKGVLRVWYANNNATWNSGNGSTVTKEFKFNRYALFNYSSLLVIDSNGYLWELPITTSGYLIAKNKIGQGWSRFQRLVTVGNKLLAIDENGDFWKFDFDVDHYWIVD